jgi:hypothetical protein
MRLSFDFFHFLRTGGGTPPNQQSGDALCPPETIANRSKICQALCSNFSWLSNVPAGLGPILSSRRDQSRVTPMFHTSLQVSSSGGCVSARFRLCKRQRFRFAQLPTLNSWLVHFNDVAISGGVWSRSAPYRIGAARQGRRALTPRRLSGFKCGICVSL